jgi:hypothetical protein
MMGATAWQLRPRVPPVPPSRKIKYCYNHTIMATGFDIYRQWNSTRRTAAARAIQRYWKRALQEVNNGAGGTKKVHRSRVVRGPGRTRYNARNIEHLVPDVELMNDDDVWNAKWPTGQRMTENNAVATGLRAHRRNNGTWESKIKQYLSKILQAEKRLYSANGDSWLRKYEQHGWIMMPLYVWRGSNSRGPGVLVHIPMKGDWVVPKLMPVLAMYMGLDYNDVHVYPYHLQKGDGVYAYLNPDAKKIGPPLGRHDIIAELAKKAKRQKRKRTLL